jgi:hypothetical protein
VVPGVYEVFVEKSVIGMNAPERKTYRPQRVLGVAVGGGRGIDQEDGVRLVSVGRRNPERVGAPKST